MIEPLLSDDALAADIDSAEGSSLHLWWLGQSGFLARGGGRRVLFDPYLSDSLTRKYAATDKPHVRMSRRVIDPTRLRDIAVVTSTHAHTDHLDAETLQAVRRDSPAARLVAPRFERAVTAERWGGTDDLISFLSDGETLDADGITVRAVAAAHDKIERDADGNVRHLGLVVTIGGVSIYHSGDGIVYSGLAEAVRACGPIDIAIVPINGKVGNMDGVAAAGLAKAVGARVAIPCHFDLFEFNTADPETAFVPECRRLGQGFRVLRLGERLTLAHLAR